MEQLFKSQLLLILIVKVFLFTFLSSFFGVANAQPTTKAANRCDQLTAYQDDPKRQSKGVAFEAIDENLAVAACAAAVKADPGNPRLQFQYGRSLVKAQQYKKALSWYRKAESQDYVAAYIGLGFLYLNGHGVEKSNLESFNWYQKAANAGIPSIQNQIALMYQNGIGVKKDVTEAAKWYRKSAEQGYSRSQSILGWMYYSGTGVEKSYTEAIRWYRVAAEQGNSFAERSIGWMYETGQGVTKSALEAMKWYRKAAAKGDPRAQDSIGFMLEFGRGIKKNEIEAVKWYRKSAKQGYATAQYNLGRMYAKGAGIKRNNNIAKKWYQTAAKQGHAGAKKVLSQILEFEALMALKKSAELGNAKAQYQLAMRYVKGDGVNKDDALADKWFKLSSQQGYSSATNYLELNKKIDLAKKQIEILDQRIYSQSEDLLNSSIQLILGQYSDQVSTTINTACFKNYEIYEKILELERKRARLKKQQRAPYLEDFRSFVRHEIQKSGFSTKEKQCSWWFLNSIDKHNKASEYARTDLLVHHDLNPKDKHSAKILGLMYLTGRGVKANARQAYFWYQQAGLRGVDVSSSIQFLEKKVQKVSIAKAQPEPPYIDIRTSADAKTLTIYFSLGCWHCNGFLDKRLGWIKQKVMQQKLNLRLLEIPKMMPYWGKRTAKAQSMSMLATQYTQCIASHRGPAAYLNSLEKIVELAKANVSISEADPIKDWSWYVYANSAELKGGAFPSISALLKHLLKLYNLKESDCNHIKTKEYNLKARAILTKEVNSSGFPLYVYNGKEYSNEEQQDLIDDIEKNVR